MVLIKVGDRVVLTRDSKNDVFRELKKGEHGTIINDNECEILTVVGKDGRKSYINKNGVKLITSWKERYND